MAKCSLQHVDGKNADEVGDQNEQQKFLSSFLLVEVQVGEQILGGGVGDQTGGTVRLLTVVVIVAVKGPNIKMLVKMFKDSSFFCENFEI